MIPYEELERALTRWKARRAGGTVEILEPPPPEGELTPAATLVVASGAYEVRDSTGELELSDAEVDEAQ